MSRRTCLFTLSPMARGCDRAVRCLGLPAWLQAEAARKTDERRKGAEQFVDAQSEWWREPTTVRRNGKDGGMSDPTQTPLAFHLDAAGVRTLEPVGGAGSDLPGTLVLPPGTYTVHGRAYDATAEGLYRFLHPMHDNQQRIVYEKDAYALMSAVCWLQSHGSRDNYKPHEDLRRIGMTGKLILTCGPFSNFVVALLTELGVPIRVVCVKTLLERNGYSDGHVLTEVRLDGRWVVFDPDPHVIYSHAGRRLSLLELVPHVQADTYDREQLAHTVPFAVTEFKDPCSGYDYGLWLETVAARDRGWRNTEFCRVVMIPVIPDEDAYWYTAYTRADHERAEVLWADAGLHYLPLSEFRTRFYPDDGC